MQNFVLFKRFHKTLKVFAIFHKILQDFLAIFWLNASNKVRFCISQQYSARCYKILYKSSRFCKNYHILHCASVVQHCVIERFWQCHREKAREGFTLLGINYDDGYLDFRVIQSPLWSNQIRIIYGRTKSDGKKSFAMMKGNYKSGSTKLSSEWLTAGDKFLYFSMVMHRRVSLEFDLKIGKSDTILLNSERFCNDLCDSVWSCKILQDSSRFFKILQDSSRFFKILQD